MCGFGFSSGSSSGSVFFFLFFPVVGEFRQCCLSTRCFLLAFACFGLPTPQRFGFTQVVDCFVKLFPTVVESRSYIILGSPFVVSVHRRVHSRQSRQLAVIRLLEYCSGPQKNSEPTLARI